MADMRMDAYRFSIAWPRIVPSMCFSFCQTIYYMQFYAMLTYSLRPFMSVAQAFCIEINVHETRPEQPYKIALHQLQSNAINAKL